MHLNAYLNFKDQCEEAMNLYAKILGGKLEVMKVGETPVADQMPAERADKVMHAQLTLEHWVLMGADAPPEYYRQPQGMSVTIVLDDKAEAERIFNALAEGGSVEMPLQQTFWAERFGSLTDRFGISWMVNCGQPC